MNIAIRISGIVLLAAVAQAQTPSYPRMAPVEQYQMPRQAEIEMARTAAPKSISEDAEILVLGNTGYEVAAKGKNGFVCMVQRSFAAGIEDPVFWNPKLRGPTCFNPESVRSFLPHITKKAEWALAGQTKEQIAEHIKAALSSKEFPDLAPGAMCYMMSKQQYLSDNDPHNWHPHLMFFVAATEAAAWGADLPGSPVLSATDVPERYTIFMVPVGKWSDGTDASAMK
jgi:hypothetical protein